MTSLDASRDGKPNHYVAPDYDILADSPILAGVDLVDHGVHGRRHQALLDVSRQGGVGRREGRGGDDAAHRGARPLLGRRCRSRSTRSSTSSPAAAADRRRAPELGRDHERRPRAGDAGGAIPERRVHQPRVLPRDEREASAAGRARAVRLRARAGDDRAVGRRGTHVVLRRSARRAHRDSARRRIISTSHVAPHHGPADEAARPSRADARAVVVADVRAASRGQEGGLLRQGPGRRTRARRAHPSAARTARRAWTT